MNSWGFAMKEDHFSTFEERRWRPIVWSPAIEVGVEAIDDGHRGLIELYNLDREASQLKDRAWTGVLLERLGNATAAHFAVEESLMSGIDYQHAATHQEEHRKLLEEFADQVDDWRDRHNSAELLCRFLYAWLLRHIVAMDIQLGRALQAAPGGNGPGPAS
jgi:hemerythrin